MTTPPTARRLPIHLEYEIIRDESGYQGVAYVVGAPDAVARSAVLLTRREASDAVLEQVALQLRRAPAPPSSS